MKVSLNTIKQYIDFELDSVDDLVKRINERLGQVEAVEDLASKYKDIVIVRVVECEKHPNADKLSVCKVDDGGVVADVPRDENGHVQVVCGAPNAREGIFAVWLPPGVTVPSSFDEAEPFVLSARELRGVMSHGMLAAADELAIGSDHNGIIELSDADLPRETSVKGISPGQDFANIFGLDDTIIDIENKMFTHRPDCFGQLGVAREIAGIFGHRFMSPDWYLNERQELRVKSQVGDLELIVRNEALEKVPRFMAVAINNVTVRPSPFWLQAKLTALGSKPINNIVDITNYLMLITSQPLHAYDYDKLSGHTLGVRMGKQGEKLPLLNGKTYEITTDDIVIVDGEKPIGMGGIMGGGNSEVSADTKNIVLECASFDMYAIRKSSMRHGLFTEAVTRFNKGQSPLQNSIVLDQTIEYIRQITGGEQASDIYDEKTFQDWGDDYFEGRYEPAKIEFNEEFINARLGSDLSEDQVCNLLTNVEINSHSLNGGGDYICTQVPFWRTDLDLPEDIVEEVGRLYGFENLTRELPRRNITPAPKNPSIDIKDKVRNSLARFGANELLSYSFVHEKTIQKSGQDISRAYRLSNALSPDLQYYRLSVLPSLLEKVHANIKSGHDEFVLFEIGKSHDKTYPDYGDGLPTEQSSVDLVYASKKPGATAAYYVMKQYVEQLALDLGFVVEFTHMADRVIGPFIDQFERSRTAAVVAYYYRDGKQVELGEIGFVGELKMSVRQAFKLPTYSAGATLDFYAIMQLVKLSESSYRPLSRFPKVTQDISLKVLSDTTYRQVFEIAQKIVTNNSRGCHAKLSPLSIYQAKDDNGHKTVTLRLEIASYEKTLTDAEVAKIMDRISGAEATSLGAVRI